jgi:hypothetical protein
MSSAGRGRGGKFNKVKRGGGKKFSRDLQPLNADGEVVGMWGVSSMQPALKTRTNTEDRNNQTRSKKSHLKRSPPRKSPATTRSPSSRK